MADLGVRLLRGLGVRLVIGAVALVFLGISWIVTGVQRSTARGDAQQTVSWFYSDARFNSFSSFLRASNDYLDASERGGGKDLTDAFGTLDRQHFCNKFDGDMTLCPYELSFAADTIAQQDNNGASAHFLVTGQVRPEAMVREKIKYSFSKNTYEPFTRAVTLTKQVDSWYIAQVVPHH